MKIPFHRPNTPESLDEIYSDSIRNGWLTTGGIVKNFEEQLKVYFNSKYVILLNSCTAGLHLSLLAKGLSKGDEFILPALTFASTIECGEYLGLRPRIIDSSKESFIFDLNKVEDELKNNTKIKAIIPMHYGGEPVNLDQLKIFSQKYGVFILDDAAHALETKYRNHKIGDTDDASAFSFYANKNITTGGEGGAVSTNSKEIADKIKKLSLHGITKDGWNRFKNKGRWEYDITELGYKYNMTDLSASFGLWQFKNIDKWQRKRLEIAKKYMTLLRDVKGLELPKLINGHAWHLFVVKIKLNEWKISRNQIIKILNKRGIGLAVHYKPINMLSYYRENYELNQSDFSNVNYLFSSIISLPIYPLLIDSEVEYIVDSIKYVYGKYSV